MKAKDLITLLNQYNPEAEVEAMLFLYGKAGDVATLHCMGVKFNGETAAGLLPDQHRIVLRADLK